MDFGDMPQMSICLRFSTAVIISGGGGFRMSFVGLQLFTWLCGLGQQEERRQNMVMTTFQQEYLQTAPLVVTELYTEQTQADSTSDA